jgi:hypothetical protein
VNVLSSSIIQSCPSIGQLPSISGCLTVIYILRVYLCVVESPPVISETPYSTRLISLSVFNFGSVEAVLSLTRPTKSVGGFQTADIAITCHEIPHLKCSPTENTRICLIMVTTKEIPFGVEYNLDRVSLTARVLNFSDSKGRIILDFHYAVHQHWAPRGAAVVMVQCSSTWPKMRNVFEARRSEHAAVPVQHAKDGSQPWVLVRKGLGLGGYSEPSCLPFSRQFCEVYL